MKNKYVKIAILLGILFLAGGQNVSAQHEVLAAQKQKGNHSTGLPYVSVVLENKQTVKMSPSASNAYMQNKSQLRTFVLVDGVYYLPSEKKTTDTSLTKQVQQQVQNQVQKQMQKETTSDELENMYCDENDFACRDFVYMVYLWQTPDDEMRKYVNGAKDDFARELRKWKRLSIGIKDPVNRQVETRQYQRLIGDDYNITALREFLERGEFTIAGWDLALTSLWRDAKQNKLTQQQIKEVKKFAKRAKKGYDERNLPILRLDNVNPYSPSVISYPCNRIAEL